MAGNNNGRLTNAIGESLSPAAIKLTVPRRAFEALTSVEFDNFCLFSCTANGHPAAAIAAVTVQPSSDRTGEDEYLIARCSCR